MTSQRVVSCGGLCRWKVFLFCRVKLVVSAKRNEDIAPHNTDTMSTNLQTGSLFNLLMSGTNGQPKPEKGMGATILGWTDRRACTIVEVSKSGRSIKVQRDIATRTDDNGMSDSQSYSYEPDPEAPIQEFTLRKNGAYVEKGANMRGYRLRLGERKEYYDFSF